VPLKFTAHYPKLYVALFAINNLKTKQRRKEYFIGEIIKGNKFGSINNGS